MTVFLNSASIFLITLGVFFLMIGSIGLIRLPDFYTRSHASGKSDTVGVILIFTGLILQEGATINSAKLLLAMIFISIANPTGIHALARAAFRFGLKPWFRKEELPEQMRSDNAIADEERGS